MIRAIIWDNDDLLVNSHPLVVKTYEIFLSKRGRSFAELPENIASRLPGRKSTEVLSEIVNFFHLTEDFETMKNERKAIFMELVDKELELMTGANYLLKFFKQHNFRQVLASSGSRIYIDVVLQKFNLKTYFEQITTGDEVSHGKPDPQIFKLAVNKLQLPAGECLVLEDATNGVEAAKAADCHCIGVRNPYTPVQDLSKADLVVKSLNDINIDLVRSKI